MYRHDKTWKDEQLTHAYFTTNLPDADLVEELETYDATGHRTPVTITYGDFLNGTARKIKIGDA